MQANLQHLLKDSQLATILSKYIVKEVSISLISEQMIQMTVYKYTGLGIKVIKLGQ